MHNTRIKHLEELRDAVVEWRILSMQALGFRQTIEYKQILFRVSARSVIADLSPLAYLDLNQEVHDGMIEIAIANLYERLLPLLECRHHWSPLTADFIRDVYRLDLSLSHGSILHVCTACTALCIETRETPLPQIGIDKNPS